MLSEITPPTAVGPEPIKASSPVDPASRIMDTDKSQRRGGLRITAAELANQRMSNDTKNTVLETIRSKLRVIRPMVVTLSSADQGYNLVNLFQSLKPHIRDLKQSVPNVPERAAPDVGAVTDKLKKLKIVIAFIIRELEDVLGGITSDTITGEQVMICGQIAEILEKVNLK